MVVLTDGDIFGDPLNLTTVINSSKMQGVVRFAIGVSTKQGPNLTLSIGQGGSPVETSGSSVSKPSLVTATPLLLATCSYMYPPSWVLQKAHSEVGIAHWLNRMGRACTKVPRETTELSPGS